MLLDKNNKDKELLNGEEELSEDKETLKEILHDENKNSSGLLNESR